MHPLSLGLSLFLGRPSTLLNKTTKKGGQRETTSTLQHTPMARFIVTSLLVAVTLAAAVDARDVVTIDASKGMPPISRKLLGVGNVRPVVGTNQINASSVASGRTLTGEDECQRTCDQVSI